MFLSKYLFMEHYVLLSAETVISLVLNLEKVETEVDVCNFVVYPILQTLKGKAKKDIFYRLPIYA